MSRVGVLRQYMATVLVNLLGVSYGMISGWSSSALPTLQTSAGDERLLESGAITLQQASWIGGALCLGGIVGTLVGGAIVDRLGRKWTAWIAGLPLVVCWVLVIVANHPVYLMGARFLGGLAGGIEFVAAERSLRFFRGIRSEKDTIGEDEYVRELQLLQSVHAKDATVLSWSDFTSRHAQFGLLICLTLMALNQFCGCFYMMNYAQSVFAESGSVLNLSPSLSVIVVGLIQLIGCYVCTLLVDRIGRKILLLISSIGLTLGQSVFASYCYGQELGYDLTSFSWLPLVCFSVIVFIGTVGVGTMPFVVLAEIMPQKTSSTRNACISKLSSEVTAGR
uniref:Major facilitator superfamily (MFS) profile domain-containing protein n=1 Tax=Anopheles merus TaxID=30066 RepID=A0A182V054_ANOME